MDEHWLANTPTSHLNGAQHRRKLALIGASQIDVGERPPLDDPEWDVWSCNSLWTLCLDRHRRFRADAWFELHPLSVQTQQELIEMYDCPVPLYVLEHRTMGGVWAPHWVTFPLDMLRKRFGDRDYFTCTMAYQVALALTRNYATIGLWGMELWQGSARERTCELRGLEFWLGVAKGMGVEIVLPSYSCLIQHQHLYGYDYHEEDADAQGEVLGIVTQYKHEMFKKLSPAQQATARKFDDDITRAFS